jgi:hypothetical protein
VSDGNLGDLEGYSHARGYPIPRLPRPLRSSVPFPHSVRSIVLVSKVVGRLWHEITPEETHHTTVINGFRATAGYNVKLKEIWNT